MIINIGRQLGSGGHEVGQRLSELLGYSFYDKELLQMATQESGISTDLFEKADERTMGARTTTWLGGRVGLWGVASAPFSNGLTNESLFQIQSDVIRKLAEQGNCIFVGRCADYILRDRTDCLSVFICAEKECRINRVMSRRGLERRQAESLMEKTDKQRAAYYNFYADRVWGSAPSYDLCINTSTFGIEATVNILAEWVNRMEKATN